MPGLRPTNTQIKLGARESVRWLVMWAYFDGGAYDEDGRFFFPKGEGEAEEAGWVALRFVEVDRGVALEAGEDMAGAETLELDTPAKVGDVGVGLDRLVPLLLGDGISAKV